jgi:hypothetical protein
MEVQLDLAAATTLQQTRNRRIRALQLAKLGYCKVDPAQVNITIETLATSEDTPHTNKLALSMRTTGVLRHEPEHAVVYVIASQHVDASCLSHTVSAAEYPNISSLQLQVNGEAKMYLTDGFHREAALLKHNLYLQTSYLESLKHRETVNTQQGNYIAEMEAVIDPSLTAILYDESESRSDISLQPIFMSSNSTF